LIEIRPETKEAIFEVLGDPQSEKKLETYEVGCIEFYNFSLYRAYIC